MNRPNAITQLVIMMSFVCMSANVFAREYEIPPVHTTGADVPWITDAAMEQCVKLYNEAKWLEEEIDRTFVDRYSQESVDAYNNKIAIHSRMIDDFNGGCAGKESESAHKAAQKLNQQQN